MLGPEIVEWVGFKFAKVSHAHSKTLDDSICLIPHIRTYFLPHSTTFKHTHDHGKSKIDIPIEELNLKSGTLDSRSHLISNDTRKKKKVAMGSTSKTEGKVQGQSSGKKNAGRKNVGGTPLYDWFIAVFGVAFILSFALNALHLANEGVDTDIGGGGHPTNNSAARAALRKAMKDFRDAKDSVKRNRKGGDSGPKQTETGGNLLKELATLDCKAYGGPSKEVAQEMVYWQDISSDSSYTPPFYKINNQKGKKRKYMTFEPDGGGWNNIRMAMESTIAMAIAMGRTLVMPPQKKMYLLGNKKDGQQHHFSFVDFFPIAEMAEDNKAFDVITMQEYLEEEAMKGNLVNEVR